MTTFRQKSASFLLYITTLLLRAPATCTYTQYLRCFNCDAETTLFKRFAICLSIRMATWHQARQLGDGQYLNRAQQLMWEFRAFYYSGSFFFLRRSFLVLGHSSSSPCHVPRVGETLRSVFLLKPAYHSSKVPFLLFFCD